MNKFLKSIIAGAALLLTASTANAQLTIFNIPESKAVPNGKLYFQEQLNIHKKTISETTLTYGLGRGWEIGVNAFDVTLHTGDNERLIRLEEENPAESPMFLLNMKKGFQLTKSWRFAVGSRAGGNKANFEDLEIAHFSYANTEICAGEAGKIVGGAYLTNPEYSGGDEDWGYMAGFKFRMIKIFNVQADYISGKSDISYITIGGGLNLPRDWELSTGVMLPSPGSRNPAMLTLQLSNL